jgi:hypothetical protein
MLLIRVLSTYCPHIGEGFTFSRSGTLFGTERSVKRFDEAISEVSGDDLFWPLRAVSHLYFCEKERLTFCALRTALL